MHRSNNYTRIFNSVEADIKTLFEKNPFVFDVILDAVYPNKGKIKISGLIGVADKNNPNDITTKERYASLINKLGDVTELDIDIKGLGGDVFTALEIRDALIEHPAKKNMDITGRIASATTIISTAGDHVKMVDTALYLLHRGIGNTVGNVYEHQAKIELLNRVDSILGDVYIKRGVAKSDVQNLLDANSGKGKWLKADEAKNLGLVDEVYSTLRVRNETDSTVYNILGLPEEETPTLFDKIKDIISKIKNKKDMKITNESKLALFIDSLGLTDEKKAELLQNIGEEVVVNEAEAEAAITNAVELQNTIDAHVVTMDERQEAIVNHLATIAAKDEIIAGHTAAIEDVKNALGAEINAKVLIIDERDATIAEYVAAENEIKNIAPADKFAARVKVSNDHFDSAAPTDADKFAEAIKGGNVTDDDDE